MQLSAPEARVAGSLAEKELATPQHYPLTVRALVAACNQTTNRDPVVGYDDDAVRVALDGLRDYGLVKTVYATGSRTPKYAHRLDEHFDLTRPQLALLTLLLLRGPQTVGELRTRAERLHAFASLAEVDEELRALGTHPYGALVEHLERRPGQKEARWRHLLGGEDGADPSHASPLGVRASPAADAPATDASPRGSDAGVTLDSLAAEVAELRADVAALRARLDAGAAPNTGASGR